MSQKYFIAGTDTGVGKTWVSCLLLAAAAEHGHAAVGLKPVAAGADTEFEGRIENEDAVALKKAANVDLDFRQLNPVCLPEPLSPHIAAQRAGQCLTVSEICTALTPGLNAPADLCLVEGAGGWRVPISESETMADLAKSLSLPVILVVGMRLGCLNHALLTAEAIQRDGLTLHAWVANELSAEMPAINDNVATLKRHIPAPLLARIPYSQNNDIGPILSGVDINKLV